MRLDLGSDGKIIGTRRVSPNGQVSGLSEFVGREVLVILPGAGESNDSTPWSGPEGLAQLVNEQIRQAYQRYQSLQEMYSTPWEATRSFLQSAFGAQVPDVLAQVDRWVKSQVQDASPGRTSRPSQPTNGRAERPEAQDESAASRRSRSSASGKKRP